MTAATPAQPGRRLTELAALGAAIAIAIGVGLYLLFAGSGGGSPSPTDVAKQMYDALAKGDTAAFQATLAPAVRNDPEAQSLIPLPSTLGSVDLAQKLSIDGLTLQETNNQDGWATVNVGGTVKQGPLPHAVDETLYLQRVGSRWFVSDEAAFVKAFSTPGTGGSTDVRGLGPLDPQRPKIGEPAPNFALLDARDETTVRHLSDYRGKAVVLNWFASWCDPCKQEIPEFQAAEDALGGQLVVLGVDYQESPDKARGILEELGAKYPAVLDSDASVAQHYRVGSGLPVTFFIDKDGILRGMRTGQVHEDDLVSYLAQVGITYSPKSH